MNIPVATVVYICLYFSDNELRRFPLTDVDKLSLFSGIVYSSPEVC